MESLVTEELMIMDQNSLQNKNTDNFSLESNQ